MAVRHSSIDSLNVDTSHTNAPGFPAVKAPPWMAEADCAQTDPEAFFPERGGSTREAKKVCATCLVQAECLDYALDHDERHGIWGGLSERERRRIKKALHPAQPELGDTTNPSTHLESA